MFNSLRIRLTLLFVGLTIIPLVIAGTLITLQGYDTLQKESVNSQEHLARQTAISLEAFFSERQNELAVLTEVYGLTSLDPAAQKDVLLVLLSKQPAYYELTLIKADGQESIRLTRGSVVTDADLTSRADDSLFQRAVETAQVSFSNVHFNEEARDRLITMAVPIEDLTTGLTSDVLVAEVRFQNVEESILRGLNLGEGEDVYIVDNTGLVIAHRNPRFVLRETVFDLPKTEGRHDGLQGDDIVLAMSNIQLENQELIVVAEKDYAEATALAFDLAQLATAITVITLLVATIIVIYAVNRVVRPIIQISRVAQAIQGGDYSKRIEMHRKDEIGQFVGAFNGMTHQLQDLISSLEARVKERTREAEEARLKAERADQVKSQFLAATSHELRTPLNAIINFSKFVSNGVLGAVNEKQVEALNKVVQSAKHLLGLINDVLDISKIEAGSLQLFVESNVNLAEEIRDVCAAGESLLEGKPVELRQEIDEPLPMLTGDKQRIRQILLNLVSNASKFTQTGHITVKAHKEGDNVVMAVSDTGPGIPPEEHDAIFETFRQTENGLRQGQGTGLGLPISRRLAEAHGGRLWLESKVNEGATFYVSLPIQPSHLKPTL
ncbi:MAG: HAMP domain-containing protein [Anaerolineae bacterium]|nr:HAMP domain-containing protein [Anaerolineae bacterium]